MLGERTVEQDGTKILLCFLVGDYTGHFQDIGDILQTAIGSKNCPKKNGPTTGTCDAPLYYIDLSTLADDGAMPTPVLAATVNDGYGHAS